MRSFSFLFGVLSVLVFLFANAALASGDGVRRHWQQPSFTLHIAPGGGQPLKAFRSAVQPVEIAAALQRDLDNNAQVLSRQRRLVPNSFVVELSDGDLERLKPYDSALDKELKEQLTDHAELQSYVFPGPLNIAFEVAEDLGTGEGHVIPAQCAMYDVRQSRIDLGDGDIDGDRHTVQRIACILPASRLCTGGRDDPLADRHHLAGIGCSLDELPAAQQAVTRMMPAQQGFDAGNPSGFCFHLGLVVELELVVLQRIAQARHRIAPAHELRVHAREKFIVHGVF